MVMTDSFARENPIIYTNKAFETLTGYTREECEGRNCRFLQGQQTDRVTVHEIHEAVAKGEDIEVDILNYRADGTPFMNRLLILPINDDHGVTRFFLGIMRRMDEGEARKRKDLALAEVQHRVKNHLAMIVSLVRLEENSRERPRDYSPLTRRIEALQLIYEELSRSGMGQSVELSSYLTQVADAIGRLDGRPGVRMNIDIAACHVPVDAATRIGMILSEVLTNALQHAFESGGMGTVEFRVSQSADGRVTAVVADNGTGMPEGINWPHGDNQGSRIVRALVAGLDASLDVMQGADGTTVSLTVPAATISQTIPD